MKIDSSDFKYLTKLCEEHKYKKRVEKRMENFFERKKIELIKNGIKSKYWIIPVTQKKLNEIEDWPFDFIKQIDNPEYDKIKSEINSKLTIAKGGNYFLIILL